MGPETILWVTFVLISVLPVPQTYSLTFKSYLTFLDLSFLKRRDLSKLF